MLKIGIFFNCRLRLWSRRSTKSFHTAAILFFHPVGKFYVCLHTKYQISKWLGFWDISDNVKTSSVPMVTTAVAIATKYLYQLLTMNCWLTYVNHTFLALQISELNASKYWQFALFFKLGNLVSMVTRKLWELSAPHWYTIIIRGICTYIPSFMKIGPVVFEIWLRLTCYLSSLRSSVSIEYLGNYPTDLKSDCTWFSVIFVSTNAVSFCRNLCKNNGTTTASNIAPC